MDPHIIELLTKIGAPGGLTAVLGLLIYVLYNVYQDLKKVQEERIEDAKKCSEALLSRLESMNETYSRVADTIERVSVADDRASDKILNEIDKLSLTVEDIEQAVKELKDLK